MRLICDNTGLKSGSIGKIDIMPAFSFFEADKGETDNILNKVNGSEYEGTSVNIEITKPKTGGDRGGRRGGGNGGRRDGSYGKSEGGSFSNRSGGSSDRRGGERKGGFGKPFSKGRKSSF